MALSSTAIQFDDRHSDRSFPLLQIADLVVDVVDVLDVSVSEIAALPPSKHLAFLSHSLCIYKYIMYNRLISNISFA